MDALTFIAEVIKALAWPAVTVFVVLFFRRRLGDLFDQITELELFGQKAKFARKVEAVELEVKLIEAEEQHPPPLPLPDAGDLAALDADLSQDKPIVNMLLLHADPAAGFALGRSFLERSLTDLFVQMTGTVPGLLIGYDDVVEKLTQSKYLTAKMRRTVKELLALGNQAAHGRFAPSVESARSYVSAVQSITDLMKDRAKRLP